MFREDQWGGDWRGDRRERRKMARGIQTKRRRTEQNIPIVRPGGGVYHSICSMCVVCYLA